MLCVLEKVRGLGIWMHFKARTSKQALENLSAFLRVCKYSQDLPERVYYARAYVEVVGFDDEVKSRSSRPFCCSYDQPRGTTVVRHNGQRQYSVPSIALSTKKNG